MTAILEAAKKQKPTKAKAVERDEWGSVKAHPMPPSMQR